MSAVRNRLVGPAVLACAAALALIGAAVVAQKAATPERTALDSRRSLGKPVSYRNLTLIPIYDSSATTGGQFTTLDEGLRAQTVKVRESKDGGDVNTLFVTNTGRKPVYLMAGEVVLGGQQDRCLGRDVIVPPGKKNLAVTVFCVEHGRWSGRREFGDTALAVASADIRASAQEGAFAAGRPATPMAGGMGGRAVSGRVAAQVNSAPAMESVGENQQKVWDRVAAKNARFKASPASGTYKEVLNQTGGEAKQTIGPYVNALSNAIPADAKLAGVVAAVNGEVVSADIFGDSTLFRKLWPKLLRSYAADAAENAGAKPARRVVSAGEAKAFLVSASDAKSKLENRSDVSSTVRLDSSVSRAYRLEFKPAAGVGGLGGSADGHVHTNVLKK